MTWGLVSFVNTKVVSFSCKSSTIVVPLKSLVEQCWWSLKQSGCEILGIIQPQRCLILEANGINRQNPCSGNMERAWVCGCKSFLLSPKAQFVRKKLCLNDEDLWNRQLVWCRQNIYVNTITFRGSCNSCCNKNQLAQPASLWKPWVDKSEVVVSLPMSFLVAAAGWKSPHGSSRVWKNSTQGLFLLAEPFSFSQQHALVSSNQASPLLPAKLTDHLHRPHEVFIKVVLQKKKEWSRTSKMFA